MNFFEHQQRARQRTWLLALLFTLATLLTVALANVAVLAVVALFSSDFLMSLSLGEWMQARPGTVLWTTLATLGAIAAATLYRMASLAGGGGSVARALGGVPLEGDPSDPRKRQLQNVVEEMAIAAGLPAPEVYVLEQEPGINAFAAGFTPSDAAIAVTRGTLELLTRDELQGVVAHEFSHILNGDMRLNTRLLGALYGILFIGLTGRVILRGLGRARLSSRRGGGQLMIAAVLGGVALLVIGYVGMLFGSMIRAALSRQREFLADASAVQFTRNPHGIAGALKKIAVSPLRTVLQAVDGEEVGHMLIADGRKMFQAFFATHPPILARIKAVEPRFDPAELENIKLAPVETGAPAAPKASSASSLPLSPMLVLAAVGNLSEAELETAARREAEIPPALVRGAHSRAHAPALVLALVLSKDAGGRARQMARLRERLPQALFAHIEAFLSMAAPLDPAHRLPLIEIAFPALRQRSAEEIKLLVRVIDELSRMDGRYDVLDYALVRLLRVQLGEVAEPQAVARRSAKLHALREEARVLLAIIAQAGSRDRDAARRAYGEGMQHLLGTPAPVYAPPEPWVAALDRALARLDSLVPAAKRVLIEALVMTILRDRRITLGEVELLRAVCASLHCPLPPLAPASMPANAKNAGLPHATA